jgi:hypothetical protein
MYSPCLKMGDKRKSEFDGEVSGPEEKASSFETQANFEVSKRTLERALPSGSNIQ